MGVYKSLAFVLSQSTAENADYPIAAWDDLVTVDTLTVDQEDADYPGTNLANPATNQIWKSGSTADQYLTCLFGEEVEDVAAVGFARHNFGSGLVAVTIEGLPFGGDPEVDNDWDELVAQQILADDDVALFLFAATDLIGVRVFLEPGSVEPQAARMFVGPILRFERGVQPGEAPLKFARERPSIGSVSQNGEYLGTVYTGGRRAASVSFKVLSPEWYRSTLDPFLEEIAHEPFFWAWRPETYPDEVAYARIVNDPKPTPDMSGNVDFTMQLEGIL